MRAVLRNSKLLQILTVTFFAQFGLGILQSTFALWGNAVLYPDAAEGDVLRSIGLLLATVGLTQFITQSAFLPQLLKRVEEPVLVFTGNLIRIAASLMYAVITTPALAFVASVILPFGLGIMMPPLQSQATHTVEDQLRGGVLGVYQSVISLAIIFGTGIGGTLFSITPGTPYWVAAAAGVVAVYPAWRLLRRPV